MDCVFSMDEISSLANRVHGNIDVQNEERRKKGVSKWKKMNSALEIQITSWKRSFKKHKAETERQGFIMLLEVNHPEASSSLSLHGPQSLSYLLEGRSRGGGSRKTIFNCYITNYPKLVAQDNSD